ncbi:ELC-like protein [Acrasis kona]|uniref:ELC-like protein n=1 Tax=Acrasis kona TaxID=1008807 RepID=A0AAW2YK91_9EUKA
MHFEHTFNDYQQTYKHEGRVRSDVIELTNSYNTLTTSIRELTNDAGVDINVVSINGTIPIQHRDATYYIPLDIYITYDYPSEKPLCFVVALRGMNIVPSHKYVDTSGKCYHHYLSNWTFNSNLKQLVENLSIAFSEMPPLYQGYQTQNSTVTQPQNPTRTNPSAPPSTEPTEAPTCVICLDASRTHACLPCGHRVLCERCSRLLRDNKCPVCRETVEYVAKIYD